MPLPAEHKSKRGGEKAQSVKIAKVQIAHDLFEMILRAEYPWPGKHLVTTAPSDLRVLGFSDEGKFYRIFAYVTSETFADIPEGAEPPLLEPFVYTVTDG